jgi:flagellar protein FliO/FliZ
MRHGIVVTLAVLVTGLLMVTVLQADQESATSVQVTEQPNSTLDQAAAQLDTTETSLTGTILPSFTRIGISLAIIIGVIYASVFLLKRLSGQKIGRRGKRTIEVVEQAFLAPKKSVCLLKLADRAVLVGITDNNINLLTEMPWDELPEDYIQKATVKNGGFHNFLSDAAGKLMGQRKNKGAGNGQMA